MFAQSIGLGQLGVGLLVALPQVTKLLCNLPVGYLVDVVGRRLGLGLVHRALALIPTSTPNPSPNSNPNPNPKRRPPLVLGAIVDALGQIMT